MRVARELAQRTGWMAVTLLVILVSGAPAWAQGPTPTSPTAEAVVAVERAVVFPLPDRNASPLTYVYERERFPVFGQSANGTFLLIHIDGTKGWLLRAQVDVSGEMERVPVIKPSEPTPTPPPPPTNAPTPTPNMPAPTRPPLPTRTPVPAGHATPIDGLPIEGTPRVDELPPVVPGSPPPLQITLPDGWNALDLEVPFRTFDERVRSVPLTIYFGPLDVGVQGFIYLYWGFPNVVDFDGEFNLWADGVQILRGSLIGETCNLGIDEQMTFEVGGKEGIGTYYAAVACDEENDTTGWFAVLRVNEGSYAFFTAIEPFDALADYRGVLQAILDTVIFKSPED